MIVPGCRQPILYLGIWRSNIAAPVQAIAAHDSMEFSRGRMSMRIDALAANSAGSLSWRERVGVRGFGLSRVWSPLTPTLSPSGRGSAPRSRHRQRILIYRFALGVAAFMPAHARAAEDFYAGKTISIIV